MASEKSPAFQFYPKDLLSDIHFKAMSLQERGAYFTLLAVCWLEQSLPSDPDTLARVLSVPVAQFKRIWPHIAPCFRDVDGRLVHPRLEAEREKQADHRRRASDRGSAGASARWNKDAQSIEQASAKHASRIEQASPSIAQPMLSDGSSSSISILQSSDKQKPQADVVDARSNRPIFRGQRIVVFEWQLDNLTRMLGAHADAFQLDAWFDALDARAVQSREVIPQRDKGAWLEAQTLAEAKRRGLPIASADEKPQPTGRVVPNAKQSAAYLAQVRSWQS